MYQLRLLAEKGLSDLEAAVMLWMLADPEVSPRDRTRSALDDLVVEDREFSAVGFMTSLVCNDAARLFAPEVSMRWGHVLGWLNGIVMVDFVVYVDDGFVHGIEGVTFGEEEWPSEVSTFELVPHPAKRP